MDRFQVKIQVPKNFELNLLRLKKEYISTREEIADNLLIFENKINRLAALAYVINNQCSNLLSDFYAWSVLNLQELLILFNNNKIREVFANKIDSNLVVTHEDFNHCVTNIIFTSKLWNAIKLQSEINSSKILSTLNPTLKTGLINSLGNFRITLQQEPLTIGSPSFLIRRLPNTPITLRQLIAQDQIPEVYVEILKSMLLERKNIIIAGEPGSGKTTLANALLLESEQSWRTIVIEDASEIILPKAEFPLLQHYSIPSLDSSQMILNRENEIIKLLHRSPDYVFLGEIQTKLDTKAIFEALSAGIRGMATTHARDFDSLIGRWLESHQLSKNLLNVIDVIVITSRHIEGNQVVFYVSEMLVNNGEGTFLPVVTSINNSKFGPTVEH